MRALAFGTNLPDTGGIWLFMSLLLSRNEGDQTLLQSSQDQTDQVMPRIKCAIFQCSLEEPYVKNKHHSNALPAADLEWKGQRFV